MDTPAQTPNAPVGDDPERWLSAIVDSSDVAVMGESLEGVITSWNRAASQIFGYTAEEAIGMPVFNLAWPGEEGKIHGLLAAMRRGERIDNFATSRRHKNGHRVFVSLSLYPIRGDDGRILGIAKIARDISAHLRNQEEQAQTKSELLAERKYRQLIEHAPDAIIEVDAAGRILIANPRAEAIFGYSREELMGASVDLLLPSAARERHAGHRAGFAKANRTRPMGEGLELNAVRKDGSEFPVEISLSPIQTDNGTLVMAVIRDITDRRKAELQVRQLQESYLAELSTRKQEAERLNHLKSEFLASVSHELRTPLHTIIGFTDLLREDTQQTLTAKQVRFVENIQRDSEHLLTLINDVLDLSRIEAGGLVMRPQRVEVRPILLACRDALRFSIEAKLLTLAVTCPEDLCVAADPTRLRQIMTNLLSNAIKFTPAGGNVSTSADLRAGFVWISVRDTGVGIPEDELAHIFSKFYQVGVTTGGVREGTGLGLAICKQLVEMQGGQIEVESTVGLGSTFRFSLPHASA